MNSVAIEKKEPGRTKSSQVKMSAAAAGLLARQLKQMKSDKDIPGISCGLVDESNVFAWEVMLMISDDDKHYGGEQRSLSYSIAQSDNDQGGFFRATLTFPPEYPHMPPKMKFETPIWHPNSKTGQ